MASAVVVKFGMDFCFAGQLATTASTKASRPNTFWIYDARTNVPGITKKDRPLTPAHFAEFEKCYGPEPNGLGKRKADDSKEDRWRCWRTAGRSRMRLGGSTCENSS